MRKPVKKTRRPRRKSAAQRDVEYYSSAVGFYPATPPPRAVEPHVPVPQKPWDNIFSILSDTDDVISRLREAVERQIGNIDWGPQEAVGAAKEKLGSSLNVLADRIRDHRRILIAIAQTLENAG